MNWIKTHKLIALLSIVILYLLWGRNFISPALNVSPIGIGTTRAPMAENFAASKEFGFIVPPGSLEAPPVQQDNRLVVRETTLSIVVKDAAIAISSIQKSAEQFGGYLVQSHLAKPEESASGTIIVRVPQEKLSDALVAFRLVGLRVVDENISGQDVTDQYVDLDSRLKTLEKTKQKFEDILDRATAIQDILNVQQQIISLQSQIDTVKGQQQLLSQTAKLSKITVYLSTDEFSLPYAPAQPWRPDVIFKLAVRSLVAHIRDIGTGLIWIAVYAPVWLPVLGVIWFLRKKRIV